MAATDWSDAFEAERTLHRDDEREPARSTPDTSDHYTAGRAVGVTQRVIDLLDSVLTIDGAEVLLHGDDHIRVLRLWAEHHPDLDVTESDLAVRVTRRHLTVVLALRSRVTP